VVLRVHDLDAMQRFYADVLGLPLLRRFGNDMAFLELPERAGNTMQAVALFVDRWPSNIPGAAWAGHDQGRSTLHHFALTVSLPNLRRAEGLLADAGVATTERTFPWAGWRSLMVADPEGNTVELVAVDPAILATE
jgi:catechol 2,3-dioxygenase-like lactoylglutathione lyase family enzyme